MKGETSMKGRKIKRENEIKNVEEKWGGEGGERVSFQVLGSGSTYVCNMVIKGSNKLPCIFFIFLILYLLFIPFLMLHSWLTDFHITSIKSQDHIF